MKCSVAYCILPASAPFAALLLFSFLSCSPKITPQVSRQSDSVRIVTRTEYVERLRDTTLYITIPAEAMQQVKKDSSHLETSVAISDAWLDEGLLFHTLENRPRPIEATVVVKDTELREKADSIVFRDVYVKEVVERRHIPKSYWWFMAVTIGCGVYILLTVYRKIRR